MDRITENIFRVAGSLTLGDDIQDIARRLRSGESLYTVEIALQVQRLNDAGIPATVAQIEAQLGYPIAEASRDELRGVIAGLNAVGRNEGEDR